MPPKSQHWSTPELAAYLMEHHGLRREEANAIAKGMAWKIRDVLLSGRSVFLTGLVTILPITVPARKSNLFGVKVELPKRFRLRYRTSKDFTRERLKRNKGPRALI